MSDEQYDVKRARLRLRLAKTQKRSARLRSKLAAVPTSDGILDSLVATFVNPSR